MTRPASFDAAVLALRVNLLANAIKITRNRDRAEDLVQDTIVKALAHHDKFAEGTNLIAWLIVIMRNTYYMQARKEGRFVQDSDGSYAGRLIAPAEQEPVIFLQDVHRCLASAPVVYREALLLAADGLSYDDIAQQAGAPIGTVKSRVNRGRAHLLEVSA